jgi:hypothetical protein
MLVLKPHVEISNPAFTMQPQFCTVTGTVIVDVHVPLDVVRVTLYVPAVAQDILYGPAPDPETTVPPPQFHVYVSVATPLPVYVINAFDPEHTGFGFTVNEEVGVSYTVTNMVCVALKPPFEIVTTIE